MSSAAIPSAFLELPGRGPSGGISLAVWHHWRNPFQRGEISDGRGYFFCLLRGTEGDVGFFSWFYGQWELKFPEKIFLTADYADIADEWRTLANCAVAA